MQPPFAHSPLQCGVWLASLVIWRVLEAIVDSRTFRRLRAGTPRHDRGSRVILLGLIVGGLLIGILVAATVPAAITRAPDLLFRLGLLLLYAGVALRFRAIAVLGTFFTTTVAVAPEQPVIETGPYRHIRHPAYTGFLLSLLGLGLTLTNNWLSLLVIMGCALLGFGYRIRVEEAVLQQQLGQPYQAYMRRTKRLIPFVL